MDILNNVGSIFTADTYLHYNNVPKEMMFERSIAERAKLRKERLGEIKKKNRTYTMNCLENILIIIEVQVICTKK